MKKYISFLSLLISMFHICINTYLDTIVFEISGHERNYYIFKVVSCIIIVFLWNRLFYILVNWKIILNETKQWIYFSLLYFIINFLLLIIVWPGIWRWDEIGVLTLFVRNFQICYWQSMFHSVIFFLSLAIFPFAGGIVLCQIMIISIIIGYLSKRIYMLFDKKVYLLIGIFCLPAILTNNLYPMRSTLYAYFMLMLLGKVILDYYQNIVLNEWDAIKIGILTGIVATWRTEGIIFLLAIPIYYIIFFRKQVKQRSLWILCLVVLVSAGSMSTLQKQGGEDSRYLITAIQVPMGELIKGNFKTNSREKDLETIDKVLSVEMLMENNGTFVFWNGGLRNVDKESIIDVIKVYGKLVLFNFPKFLDERIDFFMSTNGMRDAVTTLGDTTLLFQYDKTITDYLNTIKTIFCEEYPFVQIGNEQLRSNIIKILECRTGDNYHKHNLIYVLFYNVIPIICFIFIMFLYKLYKKRYKEFYWLIIFFLNISMVIITVPETLFMYYFPHYIVGIGLLFIMLENYKLEKNR